MAIQNSNQQGIQKRLIPPGGTAGQIPSKKTAADYDVQWVDPPESVRYFTQAEYDALTDEEKQGMIVITDAEPSVGSGGLTAEEVQTMIDNAINGIEERLASL